MLVHTDFELFGLFLCWLLHMGVVCAPDCRYIVGTLDLMVSENYLLVCLCAMAPRNKLPAIRWLHQCYTSIDRRYENLPLMDLISLPLTLWLRLPIRLKKDLKGLLVVHPAWYIKALLTLVKPFIRSASNTHPHARTHVRVHTRPSNTSGCSTVTSSARRLGSSRTSRISLESYPQIDYRSPMPSDSKNPPPASPLLFCLLLFSSWVSQSFCCVFLQVWSAVTSIIFSWVTHKCGWMPMVQGLQEL